MDPLIKSELPRRQPIKAAIERDILSMVVFSAGFALAEAPRQGRNHPGMAGDIIPSGFERNRHGGPACGGRLQAVTGKRSG